MKRILPLTLLALAQPAIAGYSPPLEYGVATTITFDLYNTDGTLDVDEADGGAEVTLYCDEAAGATATNDFVDEGPYYSLSLTAAELQCARLVVSVGATDTNNIHIWTIGSASAQVDDDGGWYDAIPTVSADVVSVSGDSTAADNQEAFFDGTGYAGTNNVIPTVTTLTGHTAQTGDSYERLGAPAGVSIAADVAAVKADTAATLVDTGTTLDGKINDIQGGTFNSSTDCLECIRDRGDATWTTGSGTGLTAIASGTAQSATGTTLVLASGETFADDELIGAVVQVTGGSTGVGQSRCISDNVGSTDTITVPTWTTTPTGTITYEIAPSLGGECPLSTASSGATELNLTASGNIGIDWANVENATSTVGLSGTTVGTVTTNTDMRGTDSAATASALATAQTDLDTITGSDGVTLATTQGNYAPATATALSTAQTDLDTLTGSDGATLATTQGNYAPATATALATAQTDLDTITGSNGVLVADNAITAGKIAADAIGASELATDAIGSDELAATATAELVTAILAGQIEDQGSGYDLQCALATILAYAGGELPAPVGSVYTYEDPSGTEARLSGTLSGGVRSGMTITCP